jgi:hypothetical protein
MDSALTSLLALSGAVIVGGAASSLGLGALFRSRVGRRAIARVPLWGLVTYFVVVGAVIGSGIWWLSRAIGRLGEVGPALESPWFFLGFGIVVGLPFSLPAVTSVWRAGRRTSATDDGKPRQASRPERLAYAKELEQQLREVGGADRKFHVELKEDRGTVLFIGGDMTREEGERLVKALRTEMRGVDFVRVEGGGRNGKWWVRV